MANVKKLQRINNLMKVIYDDGNYQLCYPSGATIWFPASSGTTTPPIGAGCKWPFPRDNSTTYPGHSGIDFPYGSGTDIHAIAAGTVHATYAYSGNTYDWDSSEPIWRGNCIVINHGVFDGSSDVIYSLYAHMLNAPTQSVGQAITAGEVIGKVGSTGFSDGNHLHFEIDPNNVRRPTNSVPSGADVTYAWMDAHASGSWV